MHVSSKESKRLVLKGYHAIALSTSGEVHVKAKAGATMLICQRSMCQTRNAWYTAGISAVGCEAALLWALERLLAIALRLASHLA